MWCFCVTHERKSLCCLLPILGVLCIVFLYQKNFLTWIAPLINNVVFKKLVLQFFNHCFVISFIRFLAKILLQILKSIKNFLVSIINLLTVNKKIMTNKSAILFLIMLKVFVPLRKD